MRLKIFGLVLAAITFVSCSADISGPIGADGSAQFVISVSLEPGIVGLIRSFAALAGLPADQPVLDGPQIAQTMAEAPGVASIWMENTGIAAIEGEVQIYQIGDFLDAGTAVAANEDDSAEPPLNGRAEFIRFEQGPAGGVFELHINRENGPDILSMLSPDIVNYLSVLMAPLATGETLSRSEYLFLVGAVFSTAIANEISRSRFRASIEFPAEVISAQGGTFSGNIADFDIPLLDLLVLEEPLSFQVVW